MTVDEKDTFIHGSNTTQTPCATEYVSPWVQGCQGEAGRIPGVPTLGIPPLRLADGPAGVRLGHVETAMPAPVGLTATFDRSLANLFGATVGRGQRATNQDVWLAPMMNMVNIPTGGRNFETLGEDPYLSGEMGVQLTLGSQSEGIIATLKHYVDNDFENGRNSTTVMIDERTQHEIELAALREVHQARRRGRGDVLVQPHRRRLCLWQRSGAEPDPEGRVGLGRLHHVRLGRHAHLPGPDLTGWTWSNRAAATWAPR